MQTTSMTDSIFYEIFWIAILFLWLRYTRFFKADNELATVLPIGLLIKIAAGYFFLYVYKEFYNSSDAYAFLNDSRRLNQVFYISPKAYFSFLSGIGNTPEMIQHYLSDSTLWSKGPSTWFNDSANVIRINSVIYFISQGNAHVHVVFMSLFSILGLRNLVIAFRNRIELNPKLFFAVLILFPSVLFWTSGILKEPFMILAIGMIARGLLADGILWKKAIRTFSGILILVCIKPYLLVCIGIAVAYFAFSQFILSRKPILSLIGFIALMSALIYFSPKLRSDITGNITVKQRDSYNVGKGGVYVIRDSVQMYYFRNSEKHKLEIMDSIVTLIKPASAEWKWIYKRSSFQPIEVVPQNEKWKLYLSLDSSASLISITPINSSFTNLIKTAPEAFSNALLRPFPMDSGSSFRYPAMFEMFLCIGFLVSAILFHRKLNVSERRLLISLAIFAVTLLILIGWTTPVSGAIVRYRIPAYIAIFIISIFVIRIPEKWRKTIP